MLLLSLDEICCCLELDFDVSFSERIQTDVGFRSAGLLVEASIHITSHSTIGCLTTPKA